MLLNYLSSAQQKKCLKEASDILSGFVRKSIIRKVMVENDYDLERSVHSLITSIVGMTDFRFRFAQPSMHASWFLLLFFLAFFCQLEQYYYFFQVGFKFQVIRMINVLSWDNPASLRSCTGLSIEQISHSVDVTSSNRFLLLLASNPPLYTS